MIPFREIINLESIEIKNLYVQTEDTGGKE
jgi:hypothetical protein